MRSGIVTAALAFVLAIAAVSAAGGDDLPTDGWRALPLVKQGKVDPAWVQIGYGGFAVEDGTLRTECDEKGLGLLLYRQEKFGDCQIRVVYKSKDAESNAGVFVRIDDGILKQVDKKHAPASRNSGGVVSVPRDRGCGQQAPKSPQGLARALLEKSDIVSIMVVKSKGIAQS